MLWKKFVFTNTSQACHWIHHRGRTSSLSLSGSPYRECVPSQWHHKGHGDCGTCKKSPRRQQSRTQLCCIKSRCSFDPVGCGHFLDKSMLSGHGHTLHQTRQTLWHLTGLSVQTVCTPSWWIKFSNSCMYSNGRRGSANALWLCVTTFNLCFWHIRINVQTFHHTHWKQRLFFLF